MNIVQSLKSIFVLFERERVIFSSLSLFGCPTHPVLSIDSRFVLTLRKAWDNPHFFCCCMFNNCLICMLSREDSIKISFKDLPLDGTSSRLFLKWNSYSLKFQSFEIWDMTVLILFFYPFFIEWWKIIHFNGEQNRYINRNKNWINKESAFYVYSTMKME